MNPEQKIARELSKARKRIGTLLENKGDRELVGAAERGEQWFWSEAYVDERLGRDASWSQIIEAANYSIKSALAWASEAEDRRLEDLATEILERKEQLAAERKDKERWRLACNSKAGHDRILELELELAAERQRREQ